MATNSVEYMRSWRERNLEHSRAYHREYARKQRRARGAPVRPLGQWTPEKQKDAQLRHHYGVGVSLYDRLLAEQNGECGICGRKPPFGKVKCLSVDHDHATGLVRGLLCTYCNGFLGRIKDDPSRITNYLKVK